MEGALKWSLKLFAKGCPINLVDLHWSWTLPQNTLGVSSFQRTEKSHLKLYSVPKALVLNGIKVVAPLMHWPKDSENHALYSYTVMRHGLYQNLNKNMALKQEPNRNHCRAPWHLFTSAEEKTLMCNTVALFCSQNTGKQARNRTQGHSQNGQRNQVISSHIWPFQDKTTESTEQPSWKSERQIKNKRLGVKLVPCNSELILCNEWMC